MLSLGLTDDETLMNAIEASRLLECSRMVIG